MPADRVVLTEHERRQAARRGLPEHLVVAVASNPQQIVPVRPGREVRQSQVPFSGGRSYLVRAIVDVAAQDILVVTVYKTSQVAKFWRTP